MAVESRVARLDSRVTTLVLDCGGPGMPRLAYWGARLRAGVDAAALAAGARPVPHGGLDADAPLGVLPETGAGFMGQPGLAGRRGRRDWLTCFELADVAGAGPKRSLTCVDAVAALELVVEFELDDHSGVLASRARLTNRGRDDYVLDWCAAGAYPLPARAGELLTFEGRWAREFQMRRQPFPDQVLVSENRTGRTSFHAFPGLVVGEPGFGEHAGEVFGFHLAWSGNHRWLAERAPDGRRQVQLGEWLYPGEIVLAPGATYTTPLCYAAWAGDGLSALSACWHAFVRRQILPAATARPRPVHVNTWEAFYYHHDLAKLRDFAERAAALGAERFVLDDGWFQGRSDDRRALGDWWPDPHKYPRGLDPLIAHVRAQGMQFGLWVEPEMVSPDSELYRAHPDWVLALVDRDQPLGRQQMVLDLARAEVSDYLFERLDALLATHAIAYLKWDMNRALTHPGRDGAAAVHCQTQALYRLLDRLRAAHPGVEIESCASGGARADFEILRRTHRIWVSDCNDALERQRIQRGFSLFFPPEVMGAHIGPSPAHTTGRRLATDFAGATALFGHFGLELDVAALDAETRERVAAWVAVYKAYRRLLHAGTSVRLDTDEPGALAHGVVAADAERALFCYARLESGYAHVPPPLRLAGLDPARRYHVRVHEPPARADWTTKHAPATFTGAGTVLGGEWLTRVGVQPPILAPQTALLWDLRAVAAAPRPSAPAAGQSR